MKAMEIYADREKHPDPLDTANEYTEKMISSAISNSSWIVENMPKGEPGECVWCGEDKPRLVNGACAPCRDRRNLK